MSYINRNILSYTVRFKMSFNNTRVYFGGNSGDKYIGQNWGSRYGDIAAANGGNFPSVGNYFGGDSDYFLNYYPAEGSADIIAPFDCRLVGLAYVVNLYDPQDDDFVLNLGLFKMNQQSTEGLFPGTGSVGTNGPLGTWNTARYFCLGITTTANIDDTGTAGRMVNAASTFSSTNGDISAGDPLTLGGWSSPGTTTNADQDGGTAYGTATVNLELL
jgi:hypothetical protein